MTSLFIKTKKYLSIILIVFLILPFLLTPLLLPKTAKAGVPAIPTLETNPVLVGSPTTYASPTTMTGMAGTYITKEGAVWGAGTAGIRPPIFGWDAIGKGIVRIIFRHMLNDIIAWIRGEGKPRFITDWKGFLKDTVELKDFLGKLGLGFLCEPFEYKLRVALSMPEARLFEDRVECSLGDVVGNIENFYNDMRTGGWKGFIDFTYKEQNNFYGAYFLGFTEKYSRLSTAELAKRTEGSAYAGFLPQKEILEWAGGNKEYISGCIEQDCYPAFESCIENCNGDSNCEAGCEESYNKCEESCYKEGGAHPTIEKIVTPGITIHDRLEGAIHADIDWLMTPDEMDEAIVAIIDALIFRLLKTTGLAG